MASVRRNLRRAGVLKKSSSTVTLVPAASAAGAIGLTVPPSTSMRHACGLLLARDASASRDTDAIDASASPRNPSDAIASRSSTEPIFDVAWRATASARSSRSMPLPLSATRMRLTPPAARSTSICVAPASSAFSSSSFSAAAGRSTTSPAAIWLISRSGSARIAAISA